MAVLETLYRTVMRRNSTYLAFVLCGAFLGEKVRGGTRKKRRESLDERNHHLETEPSRSRLCDGDLHAC